MKFTQYLIIVFFLCTASLSAEVDYQFVGKHLVISYVGCNQEALSNEHVLKEKMKEAAAASGVTILSSSDHHFEPSGVTQVLLLSESHASIHTYPEFDSCFVDLFTCGTDFQMDKFDQILTEYLKPKKASHKLLMRQESCEEVAFMPLF